MGTRSTISILNTNGTLNSIYCQFDGYLAGIGESLYMHYNEVEKVEKLISMGAVVSLQQEIDIPEGALHNFDSRIPNVTVFFQRDDQNNNSHFQSFNFTDLANFFENNSFQGFDYLFKVKNNKWYLINSKNNKLEPLKTKLIKNSDRTDNFEFFLKNKEIELNYEKLKLKFNSLFNTNQLKVKKI